MEADVRKAEVRIAEGRAIEAAEIEHRKIALQEQKTAADAFERALEPPSPFDSRLRYNLQLALHSLRRR